MKKKDRIVFDLFLLAVTLTFGIVAFSFRPGSKELPLLTTGTVLVLILLQLIIDLRGKAKPETGESKDDDSISNEAGWGYPFLNFVWLIGFVVLLSLVSYLIAVPVFTFVYMFVFIKTGWRPALSVSLGLLFFMYVTFELLLQSNL